MQRVTIDLDDEQMKLLREYARERGQTPIEAAASLLNTALSAADQTRQSSAPAVSSALDLCGLIDDPTIAPLSAQEIDRLLAAEALNPHDDQQ